MRKKLNMRSAVLVHAGVALRKIFVRRRYKDELFRRIFNNRKVLLELYNAVNDTDYSDESLLEIYTLEDAIYLSYKNDVSFIICGVLNLYEHQSSMNPNMPLRGLIYFAKQYEAYVKQHKYSIFVGRVTEYLAVGMALEEAIDTAVLKCINEGVLVDFLQKHRAEVVGMLLEEFNMKEYVKMEKRDSYEDGVEEGKIEGRIEGKIEGKRELLIEILEDVGVLPDNLKKRIHKEENSETLIRWVKLAGRVEDISEFQSKM